MPHHALFCIPWPVISSHGYGDRYYPAWVMLATTGARSGEVLGLRLSDVVARQPP
jgi:integrase